MANSRNALIQKIHIAKAQLVLDDDVYREVLKGITGETSCSKLNVTQLAKVLDHFKDNGFKVKARKRKAPTVRRARTPEIAKIRAIWITMHKQGFVRDSSESALDGYVSRMLNRSKIGENVSFHAQFLSANQAFKVLEILKNWHKREIIQFLDDKWQALRFAKHFNSLSECTLHAFGVEPKKVSYQHICSVFDNATGVSKHEPTILA